MNYQAILEEIKSNSFNLLPEYYLRNDVSQVITKKHLQQELEDIKNTLKKLISD